MTINFLNDGEAERQRVKGTPAFEGLSRPLALGDDAGLVREAVRIAYLCHWIPQYMADHARMLENEYRIAAGEPIVPHWLNSFQYPDNARAVLPNWEPKADKE